MAPRDEGPLPAINWAQNGAERIWTLISEAAKDENRKVLLGKKDKQENTSGDSKNAVFARIGSVLFPSESTSHPATIVRRVASKWSDLCKTYKEKSSRLHVTGGGIGGPDGNSHQYIDYYIPEDGPHHDTPPEAVNLWERLNQEFPFFADLHRLLSTRPNITPPVVTTGVGPHGRVVLHLQQAQPAGSQASDNVTGAENADRALTEPDVAHGLPSTAFDGVSAPPPASPAVLLSVGPVRAPRASTFGQDLTNALSAARNNPALKVVPKKRNHFEDTLTELSTKTLRLAEQKALDQADFRRRSLIKDKRDQILKLFTAGLRTQQQCSAALDALDAEEEALNEKYAAASAAVQTTPQTPGTPCRENSFESSAGSTPISSRRIFDVGHTQPGQSTELSDSLSPYVGSSQSLSDSLPPFDGASQPWDIELGLPLPPDDSTEF